MAKVGIIQKMLAYLKTDDQSILTRVVAKAQNVCSVAIRNASQAISNLKFETEQKLSNLKEQLVDAEAELANSYLEVNVEKCKTSDAINNFIEQDYLQNIANKLQTVKDIKAKIEATEKFLVDETKNINDAVTLYKEVLEVLVTEETKA